MRWLTIGLVVLGGIGLLAAGTLVIYAFGLAWLIHLGLTPADAFAKGMLPFLLGDAIKALVAAGLLPAAWLVVRRS